MRIAVSGATGLVGVALTNALRRDGAVVRLLTRNSEIAARESIRWDPTADWIDSAGLEGVDAVVHLAGENIAGGRWSGERKRRILESRSKGTRLLCETVAKLKRPPRVFLSASAIGYYGNRGEEILTEESAAGQGFLADVCKAWESATSPLGEIGIRTIRMRIGVVLSNHGGALRSMMGPFRLGLGGVAGSGKQYLSWIVLDDLVRSIEHCLRNHACSGAFNMTAPNPVTNQTFTKALGRAIHRPTLFPLPQFAARILMGEMADELLFFSQRVMPARLLATGFKHDHATIDDALAHLFASSGPH